MNNINSTKEDINYVCKNCWKHIKKWDKKCKNCNEKLIWKQEKNNKTLIIIVSITISIIIPIIILIIIWLIERVRIAFWVWIIAALAPFVRFTYIAIKNIKKEDLNKKNIYTLLFALLFIIATFTIWFILIYYIEQIRSRILISIYFIRIILKRPLIIAWLLIAIYSIVKFIKWSREN